MIKPFSVLTIGGIAVRFFFTQAYMPYKVQREFEARVDNAVTPWVPDLIQKTDVYNSLREYTSRSIANQVADKSLIAPFLLYLLSDSSATAESFDKHHLYNINRAGTGLSLNEFRQSRDFDAYLDYTGFEIEPKKSDTGDFDITKTLALIYCLSMGIKSLYNTVKNKENIIPENIKKSFVEKYSQTDKDDALNEKSVLAA